MRARRIKSYSQSLTVGLFLLIFMRSNRVLLLQTIVW